MKPMYSPLKLIACLQNAVSSIPAVLRVKSVYKTGKFTRLAFMKGQVKICFGLLKILVRYLIN